MVVFVFDVVVVVVVVVVFVVFVFVSVVFVLVVFVFVVRVGAGHCYSHLQTLVINGVTSRVSPGP